MLRTLLVIGTNLGVMAVVAVIITALQSAGILPADKTQLVQIGLMAAVFGFAGSFISLFLSKSMAKKSMRVQIIESPSSPLEKWLVETVRTQADGAGIKMPEVGIFPSESMNAFATGPSKNKSLVAVSAGLLDGMEKHEVEAVLAHEVSHAANGDMVTMALVQGVLNAFVIFIAQIATFWIEALLRGKNKNRGGRRSTVATMLYPILQMVFGVVASIIAAWFSRRREFRADAGAAELTKPSDMIDALERLGSQEPPKMPANMAALGISSKAKLFSTHPPLEDRIAALRD